jgi:NAD(P)-dependent dehydrogenase (short-subunit alcohol dehydrogenase family)
MPELMGHHAIVTGAGSGAGEAIALALAGKGARVTAIGRRLAPLEALAAQDDRIIAVSADVTDADAMASAIAEAGGAGMGRRRSSSPMPGRRKARRSSALMRPCSVPRWMSI